MSRPWVQPVQVSAFFMSSLSPDIEQGWKRIITINRINFHYAESTLHAPFNLSLPITIKVDSMIISNIQISILSPRKVK